MKPVSPVSAYAALLPDLVAAGREVGYAIAPHGSMARDFDLIAVPWTEEASSAEQLVMRLLSVTGGQLLDGGRGDGNGGTVRVRGDEPAAKPHGRMGYVIYLNGSGLYLDVSVMPRREVAKP